MKKHTVKNFLWGIILLLIAVGIIMYKLESPIMSFIPSISIWQLILGVALICILINAIIDISFEGILFSLAFLGIVFKEELHIEAIVPWTILISALLGSIALNLLLGKFKNKHEHNHCKSFDRNTANCNNHTFSATKDTLEGDRIFERVTFGGGTKYIHSDNFQYAQFDCTFGGLEVFLDKVKVPSKTATIEINSQFSGVDLYIPKNWDVNNNISNFAGAITPGKIRVEDPEVVLTLIGSNKFGGIDIKRI